MKSPIRYTAWVLSFGLMGLEMGIVSGQDYPTRPIRIFTAPPGGGTDLTARVIAQGISGPLGQPVIVENRPTALVPEIVYKTAPDGYTLNVSGATFMTGHLLKKVSYDPVRDFSPISLTTKSIYVLLVHPSVPAKSVKDLIALAKSRPGELNYSSSGIGGASHLATELFKSMAGVNIVNIPYKGGGPTITALVSGEVQMVIAAPGEVAPHVKSGRLRPLAVTGLQPSALFPRLPTVSASGVPGYESTSTWGLFAPAKTPVAVINRLNQEVVRVLNQPDVKERFLNSEVEVVASSPEQLTAWLKAQIATMSKLLKDLGIQPE